MFLVDLAPNTMRGLIPLLTDLQASRLTLIQILINSQGLNMNPLQSLYYVSPACLMGLTIPFRASPTFPSPPACRRSLCTRSTVQRLSTAVLQLRVDPVRLLSRSRRGARAADAGRDREVLPGCVLGERHGRVHPQPGVLRCSALCEALSSGSCLVVGEERGHPTHAPNAPDVLSACRRRCSC